MYVITAGAVGAAPLNPLYMDYVDILNKLTPYGLFKLTPIDNL